MDFIFAAQTISSIDNDNIVLSKVIAGALDTCKIITFWSNGEHELSDNHTSWKQSQFNPIY